MDLVEEIKTMASDKLAPDQFIVDVIISSRNGPRKITVLVDGDKGYSIDDCAELSRHLSKSLDERNLIDDNYFLEVSTPGVDHPLKLKRQYHKHIGRTLKVKLAGGVVEGKLSAVGDSVITLVCETGTGKKKETETKELQIADIVQAFVQVSFK